MEADKGRRERRRVENEGAGTAEAGGGHNLARGDYRKVHCRLPACQSLSLPPPPPLSVFVFASLSLAVNLSLSVSVCPAV